VSAATADRPVRVTIEGTARPVKHDSRYLYVEAVGQHLLVNTEALGVTVEHIEPERQWTDGDVVQSDRATYDRWAGAWRSTRNGETHVEKDTAISRWVAAGIATVLRYQAGAQ
jgi:hypothetical protein